VAGLDAASNRKAIRGIVGCAPQELGLYPTVNVRANMEFFGRWNGVTGRKLKTRINEVADALDIANLLERRAGDLSGGQKRRLHTALAILHAPRLLFLDEPTVGADVVARMKLLEAVKKIAADGCAVVVARHGQSRAELEFRGDAPLLDGWQQKGSHLWAMTADPASATAAAIAKLNGDAGRLRGVRIVPASLESAYLSITGHGVDAVDATEETNAQA
jgi:ABC-2 type transport system ATP-binding protein